MRLGITMLVVFVVIGALLYGYRLGAPWLFDDYDAIVNNAAFADESAAFADQLDAPPQSPFAGRPVVSFVSAVNCELAGLRPWAWRLLNLMVHGLNAWLAMLVLRRLTGRSTFAVVVALLWLVHPACSEPVMYITQRTTLLMAAFYLATVYCALRGGRWCAAAVVCCALGMMSKEAMVTAPVAVVLIDVAYKRFRPRLYAGLAATWIVLALMMFTGPRSETVGFGRGVATLDYVANQFVMVLTYVKLVVWPHPLVFDYGYPHPLPATVWGPAAVPVVALFIGSVALWRFDRRCAVAAMLFFIILAPTSTIVPITSEVGAERRMYLPLLCALTLLVSLLFRVRVNVVYAAIGVWLIALSALTVLRANEYVSAQSIWSTVVDRRPQNPRGHNNYARIIAPLGRDGEAIGHLRDAIDLKRDYADAHFNLGVLLARQGDIDEAVTHFRQAVELRPDRADWRRVLEMTER